MKHGAGTCRDEILTNVFPRSKRGLAKTGPRGSVVFKVAAGAEGAVASLLENPARLLYLKISGVLQHKSSSLGTFTYRYPFGESL